MHEPNFRGGQKLYGLCEAGYQTGPSCGIKDIHPQIELQYLLPKGVSKHILKDCISMYISFINRGAKGLSKLDNSRMARKST